jgi:acyl carrier protein
MRNKIKQLMAGIFQVPAAEIPDDASTETQAEWDSLAHMELMLAVEMEFRVQIPANTMLELVSLEAIEDFLRGRAPVAEG